MAQALVQRACAKLRSALGDEAVVRLNFPADLRDMLEALEAIQPVLDEAEMRLLRDEWVARWLQRALSVAYKTIDIVDDLQDLRSQAAATGTC
uniref:Disease resistance N-terminal domain-containing protein n=1 Tax=Aegilops tauschii subsp. strangulata TaxID=200361 RepID=A0A453ACF4_AEGTS